MRSQNFSDIAAKSWLLIDACKRNLDRLDRQIVECTASREANLISPFRLESKFSPLKRELCFESAKGTRDFSEETNDPEIKRLLLELADSFDRMAMQGASAAAGDNLAALRARAA